MYYGAVMKIKYMLPIIGAVLAVSLIGGSAAASEDPFKAAGFFQFRENIQAPPFRAEDLEGRQVKLEDFRGKIVILFFWTTW